MNKKSLIWLIGMPGCGKSTIGRILSEKLKKSFYDADEYFTGRFEKTPEEYINNFGETAFRQREAEALKELSFLSDSVIACGGGVVEIAENRDVIKNSGIVIYIKRDIDKLAVNGRPVSKKLGVETIYERRHILYEEWCDRSVNNDEINDCVNSLIMTL